MSIEAKTAVLLRRGLLVVLLLGNLGTAAELFLLGHYEDANQLVPLVLAAAGLAAAAWLSVAPSPLVANVTKVVMAAFGASGVLGVVLHFQANAEFQREIDPTLAGAALFWKVVQAKAPPALAPGVMVQLGLIGWLYATLVARLGTARDQSRALGEESKQ